MTEKVRELKADPEEPLMLVTDPDMICERCPNRTPDDTCVDDKNHVKSKDLELLELFGLKENQLYSYRELLQCAEKKPNVCAVPYFFIYLRVSFRAGGNLPIFVRL